MRKARRRWRRPLRALARRGDPSNTGGVVRSYTADLRRRWNRVSSLIWETVVVNDALRLGNSPTRASELPVAAARAATPFQFRRDDEGKVEDFLNWLNGAIDDEVLEVTRGPGGRISSSSQWQRTYVRASYSRGLQHAHRQLRRARIPVDSRSITDLFNTPRHAGTLALMYTRQFADLQGITQATSDHTSPWSE